MADLASARPRGRHPLATPPLGRVRRRRSSTRSPGGRPRATAVGGAKWGSFVDAIASPPPPASFNDTQRRAWNLRHSGLYDRLRTAPSWSLVALLVTLGVVALGSAQVLARRSPVCFTPQQWPGCTYILTFFWVGRLFGVYCLGRAALLSWRLWRLSQELGSLNHLTNQQRRLLGLPPSSSAPSNPVEQHPVAESIARANGKALSDSLRGLGGSGSSLGADWSAGIGSSRSFGRVASPFTPGASPAQPSSAGIGDPHVLQPYLSPGHSSPATSTQMLRSQHLGLAGSPGQYAVGDVIALEELSRLRNRHGDGDFVHSSMTGVLVGNGSGSHSRYAMGGDAAAGITGLGGVPSGRANAVHTYHTGYRRDSGRGMGSDVVAFDALEEQLGLRPDQLDAWTANVRSMLARHIQDTFLPLWNMNVQELAQSTQFMTQAFVLREVPTVNVPMHGTLTLQEMMLRFKEDPHYNSRRRLDPRSGRPVMLWAEKLQLERFLDVRGEEHRMYVLDRLMTLASDDHLWQYTWDAGGPWDGQMWSPDSRLPTDAHVLDHYFAVVMDTLLRERAGSRVGGGGARSGSDRLFSGQYRVAGPRVPDWCRSAGNTVLLSTSNQPLHLRVLHDGSQYDLPMGRLNLFYALCLFLYLVKRYRKKQLANADMSDVLSAVVESRRASRGY